MATRRVTSGGMVALAATVLGLAALACVFVATTHSSAAQSEELLYRRKGNWGGFLSGSGMYPHERQQNSLSKTDLQLLKIANAEEKKETKDDLKAKKLDNEALQVREAKKAAQRAKDAKKQHGPPALPAPYLAAAPVKKAGHLNGKDKELLHIAEKEMKADNTKALKNKAEDEKAEQARVAQKAAKAKKAAEVAAKKKAAEARKDTDPSSWGGWLPLLSKKKTKADNLDPKSLSLLKAAYDDQRRDTMLGKEARARDNTAFATMYKKGSTFLTGKAKKEALMEMDRIDRKASIGLNQATYEDDAELSHSWKHTTE